MEEIYWLICPGGGSLPISFLSSHIPCSQEKEGLSELREYCAHIVRAWDCALGGASEFRACSGWPQEAGLERCPVGEDSSSFIKPFCVSAFPGDSAGKESAYSAGDLGSIPGLGRSLEEGKVYPLQYSGLENSMDHIVHGVEESWTRLSGFHFLASPTTLPPGLDAHTGLLCWGLGGTGQLRGLWGGRPGATGEFSGSRSRGWHRF